MEDKPQKIFEALKSVGLSDEEKAEMRKVLVNLAEASPAKSAKSSRSPYSFFMKPAFAVAIVAVLLLGTVSYAAEGSLPGQALYFVKTSINESVRGALAVSNRSKAEWKARLAERRVNEVVALLDAPDSETFSSKDKTVSVPSLSIRERAELSGEALTSDSDRGDQNDGDHMAYGVAEKVRARLVEDRERLENLGDDDVSYYADAIDGEIRRLDDIYKKRGIAIRPPALAARDSGSGSAPGSSGVAPSTGTAVAIEDSDSDAVEVEVSEDNRLLLNYEYKDKLHIYSGTITVPSKCHALTVTSTFEYTTPPTGRIDMVIEYRSESDSPCTLEDDERYFEAEFEAPRGLEITGVTLDGDSVEYRIVEK